MKKEDVVKYINGLEGYRGYVQFSNRKIDLNKDIFIDKNPAIENEEGFVYEAHFCNGKESITIKQINDSWIISKEDISNIPEEDFEIFYAISDLKVKMAHTISDLKVKMAHIWQEKTDELCENLKVKKLKSVVFAGFTGDKND